MVIQEFINGETSYLKPKLEKLFEKFPKGAPIVEHHFEKNYVFIKEGDVCNTVYLLLSGKCRAFWKNPGISQYYALRSEELVILGDLAVFGGRKTYTTSLLCASPCRVISFSRADFERWMASDIELFRQLVQNNIRMLQRQAKAARTTSMETKEIRILRYLHNQYETIRHGASPLLKISDKREEIVESVGGISLRSLNRYLSQFKAQGLVSTCKGKITIDSEQDEMILTKLQDLMD